MIRKRAVSRVAGKCLLFLVIFAFSTSTYAQVDTTRPQESIRSLKVSDYARAEQFLSWNLAKLALNMNVAPHWMDNGKRFWFLNELRQGFEFIVVDSNSGSQSRMFDQDKLARALSIAARVQFDGNKLPFRSFEVGNFAHEISFPIQNKNWVCNLDAYICRVTGVGRHDRSLVSSPDNRWGIFARSHNLWARRSDGGRDKELTSDGRAHNAYGVEPGGSTSFVTNKIRYPNNPAVNILWAPNSKSFVTYKLDESKMRDSYLLQSSVPDHIGYGRPILHTYRYPYPGDKQIAEAQYFVVTPESKKVIRTDLPVEQVSYLPALNSQRVWWSGDGKTLYALFSSRDALTEKLYAVDANSGKSRLLIEEDSKTPLESTPGGDENAPAIKVIQHGNQIIWFSERNGWGHFYLYNSKSGAVEKQITLGPWTVREIVHIDENQGLLYFSASGREKGEDPYLRHLYRVGLDGRGLTLLTPENADHIISFSPSGTEFVDTFSRADMPPVTVLRHLDGTIIRQITVADISELRAIGWRAPEPFEAKAADGVTDIYGLIYRPSNFDPGQTYPIIDSIYPGPQHIRTPKTMAAVLQDRLNPASIAELGFIVVTLDGRGTPLRSREFHDYSFGNLGNGGALEDHIATSRELAKQHSYFDLTRVGIYGHSGGGFAATRAILAYPDFYKVAIAVAGNQDQRGYLARWGERYEGPFDNTKYLEASNPALALKFPLKGKLLLAWGDLDDNVSPSLSLQLVDALIKANSDFDMLTVPNTNHYLTNTNPYLIRRSWDYFVKNLLGANPPPNYEIKTKPPGSYLLEPEAAVTANAN